jgi:hypothetical protein
MTLRPHKLSKKNTVTNRFSAILSTTIHLHGLKHFRPQPFYTEVERDCTSEDRIIVSREEIFCLRQEFRKEATGLDETLQKAPLTFEITVCAAHDRTQPRSPPPLLMYSGANVRVHTAHIKANALHGSALAPAIKGFQRRYVYVFVCGSGGDLSVSARVYANANASNQM